MVFEFFYYDFQIFYNLSAVFLNFWNMVNDIYEKNQNKNK